MARYALVIGIGDNLPPFKSLTKTVGDAKAIAQVLRDYGGFHVELLTQPQQVQSRALVAAIQTFVEQRATGDEALIYYTGHGFPLVKDFGEMEAFLAPADCGVTLEGDRVTAQRNGLSMASLNRLVARANFSNLVMLLDCCHSGYLLEDALLRQTFADFSHKDYWLMTACRSFEQAWAKKSDPHSIFTGAVLAGLDRTHADERGVITAGRLFEFVQSRLRRSQQEVLQLSVGRPIELLRFQLGQKLPETILPPLTPDLRPSNLSWYRLLLVAMLSLPVLFLGSRAEYSWREFSVRQNYSQLNLSIGDQGERGAVLDLTGGCWAKKQYALIPEYLRERIFGNCRSLQDTKLEKASLAGANLSGASLSDADLSGAILDRANLSGADLLNVNLNGASLLVVNLSNVSLASADLHRAVLAGADLSGANFTGADLNRTSLELVDLSSANLSGTNLRNVRFGCAAFICTDLKNIKWDNRTEWQGIQGWNQVKNIPPALKQQLGLP